MWYLTQKNAYFLFVRNVQEGEEFGEIAEWRIVDTKRQSMVTL